MKATPHAWIQRCLTNIEELEKRYPTMSTEERLKCVREQYEVLAVARKMFHGNAKILGVNHKPLLRDSK